MTQTRKEITLKFNSDNVVLTNDRISKEYSLYGHKTPKNHNWLYRLKWALEDHKVPVDVIITSNDFSSLPLPDRLLLGQLLQTTTMGDGNLKNASLMDAWALGHAIASGSNSIAIVDPQEFRVLWTASFGVDTRIVVYLKGKRHALSVCIRGSADTGKDSLRTLTDKVCAPFNWKDMREVDEIRIGGANLLTMPVASGPTAVRALGLGELSAYKDGEIIEL